MNEHRHVVAFRSLSVDGSVRPWIRSRVVANLIPVRLARHRLKRQARLQEIIALAQVDLSIQEIVNS